MTDLLAIIQNGNGNIKLEVTGEDLLLFSNQLISRAKHELSTAIAEAKKEKYLTKEEVKKMCDVCDTTLWHWSKKNYLKPVKVGNKVRYRQSDIQKILGGHNPLIYVYEGGRIYARRNNFVQGGQSAMCQWRL